ncbi:MAG: FKBP-type peptidyl-prolyl cis-trans isomerase, partial [Sphingobium yanoikuyae]
MSTTAVPLRPIAKGSLTRLWIGVAAIALAAGGLAWAGQQGVEASPAAFLTQNAHAKGVVTTES